MKMDKTFPFLVAIFFLVLCIVALNRWTLTMEEEMAARMTEPFEGGDDGDGVDVIQMDEIDKLNDALFESAGWGGGGEVKTLTARFDAHKMSMPGKYPQSYEEPLLEDYPAIGKNEVSKENASTNWWHFPAVKVPSFKQITNNIRYFRNPDIGRCTRPEMCGAVYHDKPNISNEVLPLPPVEETAGARVGYFRTAPEDNKLYWSIPTNENILY